MSEAEGPFLREGYHLTVEEFNQTLATRIAEVSFDQTLGKRGNIQRVNDMVEKVDFNPFDLKTWRRTEMRIKQYRILINPYLDEDTRTKSFLFNVVLAHFDSVRGLSNFSTLNLDETRASAREETETAQRESDKFYEGHSELVKDLLKGLTRKYKSVS